MQVGVLQDFIGADCLDDLANLLLVAGLVDREMLAHLVVPVAPGAGALADQSGYVLAFAGPQLWQDRPKQADGGDI